MNAAVEELWFEPGWRTDGGSGLSACQAGQIDDRDDVKDALGKRVQLRSMSIDANGLVEAFEKML